MIYGAHAARGTRNLAREAAMTDAEALAALAVGIEFARELEVDVLGLGEMGIANTTAASAICAALTHAPAAAVEVDLRLGEGTGAALALPVLAAAIAAHNEMATFTEAGVSDKP